LSRGKKYALWTRYLQGKDGCKASITPCRLGAKGTRKGGPGLVKKGYPPFWERDPKFTKVTIER
jgi:hypothetical protein